MKKQKFKKLTQNEMSEMMGISFVTISRYKKDNPDRYEAIKRGCYAMILNLDVIKMHYLVSEYE